MAPEPALLAARGLSLRYGENEVLHEVDLDLARGEVFVLLGPSGCGKSTLLKCLTGLLIPDQGRILVEGEDIASLDEARMLPIRRRMGVAFQGNALFQSMSVLENVAFPIVESGLAPREEALWVARVKLSQVGLGDAADRTPGQLSGGMRKRAAIARALALAPDLLFLDEPTSGLDPVTAASIDDLVLRIHRESGATVFAVTHDIASAFRIATRAALMVAGRLVADQPPELLRRNRDERIRAFLSREPEPWRPAGGLRPYLAPGEVRS